MDQNTLCRLVTYVGSNIIFKEREGQEFKNNEVYILERDIYLLYRNNFSF